LELPLNLDIAARERLRERGFRTIWISVGISIFLLVIIFVLTGRDPLRVSFSDGLPGILFFGARIGCCVAMGFGMADLAESKGHSRANGFWAVLYLFGLMIVTSQVDRYKVAELMAQGWPPSYDPNQPPVVPGGATDFSATYVGQSTDGVEPPPILADSRDIKASDQ
jgi:hypothetical protein